MAGAEVLHERVVRTRRVWVRGLGRKDKRAEAGARLHGDREGRRCRELDGVDAVVARDDAARERKDARGGEVGAGLDAHGGLALDVEERSPVGERGLVRQLPVVMRRFGDVDDVHLAAVHPHAVFRLLCGDVA